MSNDITIYTSNTCSSCKMVKQYLHMKGKNYQEVNIEQQPDRREEMVAMTGQMTVPVTVVTKNDGSKDVTVGYNLGKLSSALA